MVAKKGAKTSKLKKTSNSVDVTSAEHIPQLVELLEKNKNKLIVVLIWANYCGHCHTYKEQVWNKLLKERGRKAGMASIHYDQLETTPPEIPKNVSGYPTVLFLGKNNVPMKFKNGETEYPDSRNPTKMRSIITSENPGTLLNDNNTPKLSDDAEGLASLTNPKRVLASINSKEKPPIFRTPNPYGDILNSQRTDSKNSAYNSPKQRGGLYRALLSMLSLKEHTRSSKAKRGLQTKRIRR
jgi:thiol-disulfide isomerase/thioredoxin